MKVTQMWYQKTMSLVINYSKIEMQMSASATLDDTDQTNIDGSADFLREKVNRQIEKELENSMKDAIAILNITGKN